MRHNIQQPLPGRDAQLKMAPFGRDKAAEIEVYDNAKQSAVLILLYPFEQEVRTVLMRRSEYPGVHSGQISFPGGRRENDDLDLKQTALREAKEELNVNANDLQLIGELTELYIPPSNSLVYPFVAWSEKRPDFVADPVEVAEILESDVLHFASSKNVFYKDIKTSIGILKDTPYYELNKHHIWGATAMIISELMSVIAD